MSTLLIITKFIYHFLLFYKKSLPEFAAPQGF